MRLVACPVALHPDGAPRRLAIATKPQLALVHTDIAPDARPENTAAQALYAIGGLETRAALLLGTSDDIVAGQRWHFARCHRCAPTGRTLAPTAPCNALAGWRWTTPCPTA